MCMCMRIAGNDGRVCVYNAHNKYHHTHTRVQHTTSTHAYIHADSTFYVSMMTTRLPSRCRRAVAADKIKQLCVIFFFGFFNTARFGTGAAAAAHRVHTLATFAFTQHTHTHTNTYAHTQTVFRMRTQILLNKMAVRPSGRRRSARR